MKIFSQAIGLIHFIGIGGIGMSGIAEVLHNLGYKVQGSDLSDNANVQRLRAMGIPVMVGQTAENIGEARIAVISSAIKADNPELMAAKAKHLPIVRRAEMLGELMRLKWNVAVAGTHGKTTTTTLTGHLFEVAGLDPTLITGGIVNATGTNTRLGQGDWMVVETDESDGSFLKLPATIAIVTNIDPEHLDHYGSFEMMKVAFDRFLENIPFYGFGVLCADHPETVALKARVTDRRLLSYGFADGADVQGINIETGPNGCRFDVVFSGDKARTVMGYQLPMHGRHNVQNALASITIANELGMDDAVVQKALASFGGVERRFTKVGEAQGVTIIDDYGHHPAEIAATLKAARGAVGQGRIVAVMQPHRYTRLSSLFVEFANCFSDANHVLISDVYPAGEKPIEGADRDHLTAAIRATGHPSAHALQSPETLAAQVAPFVGAGDMVVCLGAGSITYWAKNLAGQLQAVQPQNVQEVA